MADCVVCGKALSFWRGDEHRRCDDCVAANRWPPNHPRNTDTLQQADRAKLERQAAIDAILLTTETYPQGLTITRRIEVVTAECAFGMNIFKDLFAGVRDIVGGRSEAVQKTLRDARRTALYELKKEAHAVGANAVVGVDLDYIELSTAGSMILLVASGTAVIVSTDA
jgi:uncharacterized protein YbjQ (UPF0145 family)